MRSRKPLGARCTCSAPSWKHAWVPSPDRGPRYPPAPPWSARLPVLPVAGPRVLGVVAQKEPGRQSCALGHSPPTTTTPGLQAGPSDACAPPGPAFPEVTAHKGDSLWPGCASRRFPSAQARPATRQDHGHLCSGPGSHVAPRRVTPGLLPPLRPEAPCVTHSRAASLVLSVGADPPPDPEPAGPLSGSAGPCCFSGCWGAATAGPAWGGAASSAPFATPSLPRVSGPLPLLRGQNHESAGSERPAACVGSHHCRSRGHVPGRTSALRAGARASI